MVFRLAYETFSAPEPLVLLLSREHWLAVLLVGFVLVLVTEVVTRSVLVVSPGVVLRLIPVIPRFHLFSARVTTLVAFSPIGVVFGVSCHIQVMFVLLIVYLDSKFG
jgi:hypothetical protein